MRNKKFLHPKVPLKQKIALVLFGLFLFLVLLEASLRLGGFILLSIQEQRNRQSITRQDTYRILCLGESTTQGQYPSFLEESLNQPNIGIRFKVIDAGLAGVSSSLILARLEAKLNDYRPDMVVVMMGINDLSEFLPYKVAPASKLEQLIKDSRLYKLFRLLGLHIRAKAKELAGYLPKRIFQSDRQESMSLDAESSRFPEKEDYDRTVAKVRESIVLNPNDDMAYVELGLFYEGWKKLDQAEELFKKAITINPANYEAYIGLGWVYHYPPNNLDKAKEAFSKAMEIDPRDDRAYSGLGWTYILQNKFDQAEEVYKKAVSLVPVPNNERMYAALATLCQETGKSQLEAEYRRKACELRSGYYNPLTIKNYRKLKFILDSRKITLVCVQYPMHSVDLLKRVFPDGGKVIFVDNEGVFKDALRSASYRDYFVDRFAGDFGHCTSKGNRLLGENIAKVILEKEFNR